MRATKNIFVESLVCVTKEPAFSQAGFVIVGAKLLNEKEYDAGNNTSDDEHAEDQETGCTTLPQRGLWLRLFVFKRARR